MKIIEQGKLPENTEYIHRCHNCKTKFSFLQKEATANHCIREGSYLTVHCPFCKRICSHDLSTSNRY